MKGCKGEVKGGKVKLSDFKVDEVNKDFHGGFSKNFVVFKLILVYKTNTLSFLPNSYWNLLIEMLHYWILLFSDNFVVK